MKILAFDTAMAACSAAVIDTARAEALAHAFVPMERGHAEALAPMIEAVMGEAGLEFGDLDRIAVTTGPGTFTGVRIGLSMARGLSLALGIPAIGIDTLRAISANESTGERPLVVACDARNGEIYCARFEPGRHEILPPCVMSLEEAAAAAAPDAIVIGSAADAVIAASRQTGFVRSKAGDLPVARVFGRLAAGIEASGAPSPLYLRAPDAKPQATRLRPVESFETISAGPAAADVLAGIHGEAFDAPWTAAAFRDVLSTPGAESLVGSEMGEPLGFVLTRSAADEAEIITIATRPQARRRGVARRILEAQVERLRANGIASLFLEVGETNQAARSLYSHCGFAEAGRRKGYYARAAGPPEDAIVMRRTL